MSAETEDRAFFSGGTFVVTGAGRGQGAAEVALLLEAGAAVVAVDRDPIATGWAADASIVEGDVSDERTWERVATAIGGRPLRGLVNNAGVTLRKTVTETSLPEWERLLGINLSGAFLGIRRLGPLMPAGGSIVNVSSTAGATGYFSAAYTASKWGLRGLTKAAAIEFAPHGVRVNAVLPGLVDTPMALTQHSGLDDADARGFYEGNRELTPLGRGADPREIARSVLFLLSPASSFITGADLAVDGGMLGAGIYSVIGRRAGKVTATERA
ncbi:SDR family NAD(P)-dependent oxidoreductase [Agrococcus sp. Marseille-P2731]|uniref:SDR family NAD(P)-dependent oxidoreductase n=1 Tax=Agrococcus sp. Marseille-P2731 TaxID=1841862 RepID=UPI000930F5D9|nr:SDR family oxidoreductase [Agrococcus sp. Marseille-P2731]